MAWFEGEDAEYQPAIGSGGVNALVQADEVNAKRVELAQSVQLLANLSQR
jgi:hypothetical protein